MNYCEGSLREREGEIGSLSIFFFLCGRSNFTKFSPEMVKRVESLS
jgi:hypothetical protein